MPCYKHHMDSEILHTCSYCGEQKKEKEFLKGGRIAKSPTGKSECTRCFRKKIGLNWEKLEKKDAAAERGNFICAKCGAECAADEFRYDTKYKGKKYRAYCLRCETGLSKEEYESRKDKKRDRLIRQAEIKKISLQKHRDAQDRIKYLLDSGLEKRCGKCGETKSVAQFSTAKSSRTGFYSYCKPCAAEAARIRRQDSVTVRVAHTLRARLRVAVRKYLQDNHISAVRNLGCSLKEFVQYIESLMDNGMSWDNFGNRPGQWCFDHIVPLVHGGFVDISKPEQAIKASHYTNIRPMWTGENMARNGTGCVESELRELGLLMDDGTVIFPCDKKAV